MDTFLEAEKRTIMAKDNKNKQFTELSDEDLKQVTGGAGIDCSLPENKDNIICNAQSKRKTVVFQGVNMSPNPVDFQVITKSLNCTAMIE